MYVYFITGTVTLVTLLELPCALITRVPPFDTLSHYQKHSDMQGDALICSPNSFRMYTLLIRSHHKHFTDDSILQKSLFLHINALRKSSISTSITTENSRMQEPSIDVHKLQFTAFVILISSECKSAEKNKSFESSPMSQRFREPLMTWIHSIFPQIHSLRLHCFYWNWTYIKIFA